MNKFITTILAGFILVLSQSAFADATALRNEGKQHVLHFAAVSHLITHPNEEVSLSATNQDIVSHIKTSASAAIASFKIAVNANEDKALRDFAQYALDVCDKAGLEEYMVMAMPKMVAQDASMEDVVALIKRAVKAIDGYCNVLYAKPLYRKAADLFLYNYVTARLIPNVLMYVSAPILAVGSAYGMISPVEWSYGSQYLYFMRPHEKDYDEDKAKQPYNQWEHRKKEMWQESEEERIRQRDRAWEKFNDESIKKQVYNGAQVACVAVASYFAGKFLMKLQEQRYLDRENKKQKNALLKLEMGRVAIHQQKEKSNMLIKLLARIPWLKQKETANPIVVPADIKNAAEFLHNPSAWWRTQTPGIRGLVMSGPEATHRNIVQALAKETKTAFVEISFLQASYKEKVQALMNRAQDHAMAQPNKSMIIHIDNIDFIASGSKAAKNIAQIVFNAQSNPYLNILVVGSVQNRAQIPAELKPYFA